MGGFQHKQVAIFGAGTNWGKSSYAVLVSDLAFDDKKRPLLVSFEDPEELYGRRLAARRAQVSPNVLRNGKYGPNDAEWGRVLGVAERAEQNPFFLNAIGKTVERVATDIRCLCAAEQYDLIIIDYLQAIQSSRRHQDKKNEMTYVARTLTDVIKTSGCAGLMFSQFRRPLKEGEKPTMHMLKESGDLENAAEVVMIGFLDNDGTHVIRSEKVKDGIKHKEYQIGWNDLTCGFTGELAVIDDPEPLQEYDARYP
jgi:replicative DNA helicase